MSIPQDKYYLGGNFHGITIEVDGKVLGKIKEWKPQEIEPTKLTIPSIDYLPSVGQFDKVPPTIPIRTGKTWLEIWRDLPFSLSSWCLKQESTLPLEVKSQLEMWGVELGEPIPNDCIQPLLNLFTELGYRFHLDTEASLDWPWLEGLGLGAIKKDV